MGCFHTRSFLRDLGCIDRKGNLDYFKDLSLYGWVRIVQMDKELIESVVDASASKGRSRRRAKKTTEGFTHGIANVIGGVVEAFQ